MLLKQKLLLLVLLHVRRRLPSGHNCRAVHAGSHQRCLELRRCAKSLSTKMQIAATASRGVQPFDIPLNVIAWLQRGGDGGGSVLRPRLEKAASAALPKPLEA